MSRSLLTKDTTMRITVYPAGRSMVRVESPRVVDMTYVLTYGKGGYMSIERFLDFVEKFEPEITPSKDLREHFLAILKAEDSLDPHLGQLESLMPFQQQGVAFLWRNRGALLTDEQGLGKTIQALSAIEPNRQALVICPAFLRLTWYAECRRWRKDLTPAIVEGKLDAVPEPNHVLIASYESLPLDAHKIGTFFPGTVLVADEAQMVRNYSAERTRLFRSLARVVRQSGFVWLLTGTPVVNEPDDLWSLLQACGIANEVYGNRDMFDKLWGGYRTVQGICWGKPKQEAMNRVQPHYLRRNRLEVLPELPGKIYSDLVIDVAPTIRDKMLLDAADQEVAEFKLDDLSKIRSTNVSTARRALSKLKLPTALARAKVATDPLVVFTCFKETARAFEKLKDWKVIDGDEPMRRRQSIVEALQRGELRGVACTIATAGLGFTMTASHDALFVDETFSYAENAQAEDRLCRIGQDKVVQITRIVANHQLDKRVHQILAVKRKHAQPMMWGNAYMRPSVDRLREFMKAWKETES